MGGDVFRRFALPGAELHDYAGDIHGGSGSGVGTLDDKPIHRFSFDSARAECDGILAAYWNFMRLFDIFGGVVATSQITN